MIRPIVTNVFELNRKAEPAGQADLPVVLDLLDTLRANADRCVGLAANMIGVNKRIIVVDLDGVALPMLNPTIVKASKETYETEEGCLSHTGVRSTTRHAWIEVSYQDLGFHTLHRRFSGFAEQIIQHEIDHCAGVLI